MPYARGMKPDLIRHANNRSCVALISLSILVLTIAACGPGVNAEGSNIDETSTISTPSPLESPLFNASKYRFAYFCIVPDGLLEVKRDAKLVDDGLLLPVDVEQNLRTLGTEIVQHSEWMAPDWQLIEGNPDTDLLSDYESAGRKVLQYRLDLLRGENLSLLEVIDELDNLAARGETFCEWLDSQP